jgi:Skp family chaperone for outer membrane proteins
MVVYKAIFGMRKHFLLAAFFFGMALTAQTARGVKIGYIDMEYILQNVPDYAEANNQLEQKAQKWKQEIETKKNDIQKLKDALATERVLLTKELIDEREDEIRFQESELSDYQQKRFGPAGDLMTQKAVLVKPIQDQVFTAAQDIADAKKYDFIFDKSSDLTILFAAKRFDISDQVVRALTRASKRQQMSNKELKLEQQKEAKEDMQDENPTLAERQKKLDEKKAEREKLIADRKAAADARKKEAEDRRKQLLAEKEAKKNGTPPASANPTETGNAAKTADSTAVDPRKAAADERARLLKEKQAAAAARRAKAIADREAAKKANENKDAQKSQDSLPSPPAQPQGN